MFTLDLTEDEEHLLVAAAIKGMKGSDKPLEANPYVVTSLITKLLSRPTHE